MWSPAWISSWTQTGYGRGRFELLCGVLSSGHCGWGLCCGSCGGKEFLGVEGRVRECVMGAGGHVGCAVTWV